MAIGNKTIEKYKNISNKDNNIKIKEQIELKKTKNEEKNLKNEI